MTFQYNQLGLVSEVDDAVGTRTFTFDESALTLTTEAINTSGDPQLYYRHITREYEPWTDAEGEFFYHATTGRLQRIIGPGLPSYLRFARRNSLMIRKVAALAHLAL